MHREIRCGMKPGQKRDYWRLGFHLMPPDGWLNDPNGLCQYNGRYHVFFQYRPNDVKGTLWGEYAGEDLMHLSYVGEPLWPEDPYDTSGCYSGSALPDGDHIKLYYTGNIKVPGDYDYTHDGRLANEMLVEYDGEDTFGGKQFLFGTFDYPDDCTRHVRDPKVWKENGVYYMVLGARMKDDCGAVLFYRSTDGRHWAYMKKVLSDATYGYMLECPDYFSLNGVKFLSCCPQGVPVQAFHHQNYHLAGYFRVFGELEREQVLGEFHEWDHGFDFYAAQSFTDESGRRILIGWLGLPGNPYRNPTDERGWENCLTLPRVLTERGSRILQNPAEELRMLRYDEKALRPSETFVLPDAMGDFEVTFPESMKKESWSILIDRSIAISYTNEVLRLELAKGLGQGRRLRKALLDEVTDLRILIDTSAIEVYVNGGAVVMTTRFYPLYTEEDHDLEVVFNTRGAEVTGWRMHPMATNLEYMTC